MTTTEAMKYLKPGAIVPVDVQTTALLVNALREALASQGEALASEAIEQKSGIKQVIELYDSPDQPPQRQARSADTWVNATTWRGLTAEERNTICENAGTWREAMKVIEAKLKEKNCG